MQRLALGLIRYATLTVLTALAVLVMWWVSRPGSNMGGRNRQQPIADVPTIAAPKVLVAVNRMAAMPRELTATFTGKVQPWETYSLAFEVGGRVAVLGENGQAQPLDDGDTVMAGQTLARLDDRIFIARKSEATAQLEQATTDMRRIRDLRQRNLGAVTETEFQQQLTELALARAQHEVALKNLEDAVLAAPVAATISRRLVNVGESVQPNQAAFELVQVDELLLVVDVPESQIPDLQSRWRTIQTNCQRLPSDCDLEDRVFRAYVTLEGHDRFGRRRPTIPGEVYRISQMADPRTGLFEVEIRVPNQERSLRPGMVATAKIVTDRLDAYRLPENAVIFRNREAHVFAITRQSAPMQVMFWTHGSREVFSAHRVPLSRWIDQGSHIVVPAEDQQLGLIVVRGQQRLSDGQFVRIAGGAEDALLKTWEINSAHAELAEPSRTGG